MGWSNITTCDDVASGCLTRERGMNARLRLELSLFLLVLPIDINRKETTLDSGVVGLFVLMDCISDSTMHVILTGNLTSKNFG